LSPQAEIGWKLSKGANDVGDERRSPSIEEIERAYRRPLPGPSDSAWVRFVYRNQRRTQRHLKLFMVFWFGALGLITCSAAIDVFGHMGWGYHLKDVLGGLLMMGLGLPAWGFFVLIQDIVSEWTKRVYGPDPSEHRQDEKVG
jgi:hypothetical protein